MVTINLNNSGLKIGSNSYDDATIYKKGDGYEVVTFKKINGTNSKRTFKYKNVDFTGMIPKPTGKLNYFPTGKLNYFHSKNSKGNYINLYK